MAPPKRQKKPLLQDPLPASSSSQDVQVEEEQLQEVSTLKKLNDPKTHSSDDDDHEEESDSELAKPLKLKPTASKPSKTVSKASSATPLKPSPKKLNDVHSSSDDEDEKKSDSKLATPPKLKPMSSKPTRTVSKASSATPLKPSAKKPTDLKTHSSDDDEEEESDSEQATPLKLKPMSPKSKRTVSAGSSATPLKLSTTAKKRRLKFEKGSKKKKKMKKEVVDEGEEEGERNTEKSSVPFQRLWSEADEIVILKGMIESKKKGVEPSSDLSGFLESIKESLHVKDVNPEQLRSKIRRLKDKYLKKAQGGEDPIFSNSHDQHLHGLSKEIWGVTTETLADISTMKLERSDGSFHPCVQEWLYPSTNKNMAVGESFLKQGLDLIGEAKKKGLEQKWRKLTAEELKLYLRRLELTREQTIAALDAHKSSDVSEQ